MFLKNFLLGFSLSLALITRSDASALSWCSKGLANLAGLYVRMVSAGTSHKLMKSLKEKRLTETQVIQMVYQRELAQFAPSGFEGQIHPAVKRTLLLHTEDRVKRGWPLRAFPLPGGFALVERKTTEGHWNRELMLRRNAMAVVAMDFLVHQLDGKEGISEELSQMHMLTRWPGLNGDSFSNWIYQTIGYRKNASVLELVRQLQEATTMWAWAKKLSTLENALFYRIEVSNELPHYLDQDMPASFDFRILENSVNSKIAKTVALVEVKQIQEFTRAVDLTRSIQSTSEKWSKLKDLDPEIQNGIIPGRFLSIQVPWVFDGERIWEKSKLRFKLNPAGDIEMLRLEKSEWRSQKKWNLLDEVIEHLNLHKQAQHLDRIDLQTPQGRPIATLQRLGNVWTRSTPKPIDLELAKSKD